MHLKKRSGACFHQELMKKIYETIIMKCNSTCNKNNDAKNINSIYNTDT